jgi:hypothetical protein
MPRRAWYIKPTGININGGWLLPYGFTFYIIFSLIDLFGHIDYSHLRHFGKEHPFHSVKSQKSLETVDIT